MSSMYERVYDSGNADEETSLHLYEKVNYQDVRAVHDVEGGSEEGGGDVKPDVEVKKSLKDQLGHVLTMETGLMIIELVLLIICTILYSNIGLGPNQPEFLKIYPNIIFSTFIIFSFLRIVSTVFQWHISKKLTIFMNCIGAVLIGSSGGMVLFIWYDYSVEINSEADTKEILLAESLLALLIPFVYLMDIAYLVNSLKSLSF